MSGTKINLSPFSLFQWLVNTPQHVNVTTMEIMPTEQANGPQVIYRRD